MILTNYKEGFFDGLRQERQWKDAPMSRRHCRFWRTCMKWEYQHTGISTGISYAGSCRSFSCSSVQACSRPLGTRTISTIRDSHFIVHTALLHVPKSVAIGLSSGLMITVSSSKCVQFKKYKSSHATRPNRPADSPRRSTSSATEVRFGTTELL